MNIYAHTRARESMLYKLTSGSPRYAKSVSGVGGGAKRTGEGLAPPPPLPDAGTYSIPPPFLLAFRILRILAYWDSKNIGILGF